MTVYDPEILDVFLCEARERLENFQKGMLVLEANPGEMETVHALFRDMHTIKGNARCLDCPPVSGLCHVLEDYLDDLRHGKVGLSQEMTSGLLAAVDRLNEALCIMERQEAVAAEFTADLICQLTAIHGRTGQEQYLNGEDAVVAALKHTVHEQSEIIRTVLAELDADPALVEKARLTFTTAWESIKNACHYVSNDEALALVHAIRFPLATIQPGPEMAAEKARLLIALDHLVLVATTPVVVLTQSVGTCHLGEMANSHSGSGHGPSRVVEKNSSAIAARIESTCGGVTGGGPGGVPGGPGDGTRNPSSRGPGDGSCNRSDSMGYSGTTLRVEQSKIDRGITLAGELSIMRSGLRHAARQLARDPSNLAPVFEAADVLDRIANEIEEHSLGLRRVAMRQCFGRFTRIVRDLGIALSKDISLVIEGDGIEVDKTVVEALGEPLVHVLRNACDHGLESGDERERVGKPRRGVISVNAAYEGKQVVIEVSDDGPGIPVDKVAAKALNLGLITAEALEHMNTDDRAQLVFLPGLSTAEKITDVSGRGVGMDVVKRTVDTLGGQIHIRTKPGLGTTFRIVLPPAAFTLSVTACVLVRVAGAVYALPMEAVRETLKVPLTSIHSLGGHPAICLRGDLVPIRPLAGLLKGEEVSHTATGRDSLRNLVREGLVAIAILNTPQGLIGLVVDQLIGQQGLVVKPLPSLFGALPGISGASIQADGSILLMVDATSLIGDIPVAETQTET